ncbi:MAG: hypothetical protein GY845_23785 [Planctomycetes bacterium]|nr:hypothetical protein [Planctomycetota bacterium]
MTTFILLVALIICLVGSLLVSKGIRLTAYTSNRSRSTFLQILFTILGSLVGGWMFFGLSAVGYEAGVVGYAIGLGYALGLILLAMFIPRIKQAMDAASCDTMDDFIGVRYGRFAQGCVTAINLLFFLAVLAAQFIAMTAFLKVFVEVESSWLFYVAVFVVVAYTAIAGFKGVLLTDIWQFLILSISAIVIFVTLTANTNWTSLKALDTSHFNGTGYGMGFLIGVLVFFPPSLLVRTDLWQRVASAHHAKTARSAFLVAAPILLVFYFLLTSVGIYGRAILGPEVDPDTSGFVCFLNVVRHSSWGGISALGEILLSIMSLGVFAALLSTADTNLNIVSVAVAKLLRHKEWQVFERDVDDKIHGPRTPTETRMLIFVRGTTFVLGLLAVGVAKAIPDIVDLMVSAASAIMVFLPAVLAGLLRGSRNSGRAVASIIAGAAVLIVMLCISPKTAFLPATLVSFIVYGGGAFLRVRRSSTDRNGETTYID